MSRLDPRPVWKAIVNAGGLMPASDAERARFLRVKATHRAVYRLPKNAHEDELIEAREGDRRSRWQLAGLYLADYAKRLDPDDPDLEDVDRAALPWRNPDTAAEAHEPDAEPEQLELVPGQWGALLAGQLTPADL